MTPRVCLVNKRNFLQWFLARQDLRLQRKQRAQVVEIANGILASQIGIIEGTRELTHLQWKVTDHEFDPDFIPFIAVASETDALPIGKECAYWASNALVKKDREIKQADDFYREEILAAYRILVAKFTQNTDTAPSEDDK